MYGYHFRDGRNVFIDSLRPHVLYGDARHIHLLMLSGTEWSGVGKGSCGRNTGWRVRSLGVEPGSDADLLCELFSFFLIFIYLFIWLRGVLVAARGTFSCGTRDLVP